MFRRKKGSINCVLNNGIGHQLFQLFNSLSLSRTYNFPINLFKSNQIYPEYVKIEQYGNQNQINLFKNLKIKQIKNLQSFGFPVTSKIYEKINLKNLPNNLIGYFESFKFFWDQKDYVISQLHIENELIRKSKQVLEKSKKIIGIHFKHQTYNKIPNFDYKIEINYYLNILANFSINEYQLVIFSDDYLQSNKIIGNLGFEFFNANDIFSEEEDIFYLFLNCPIKISSNSLFSLMGCLLSEMTKELLGEQICYFPNTWSGNNGYFLNVHDLIPNFPNFKIVQTKKCAVIFFHKNITEIYENYWIEKCRDSILNQNNIIFDIVELNYGNTDYSIFNNSHKFKFFKKDLKTHTEAMIFLLNYCFENGYDLVFNTNLDDYYDCKRFYYQYIDIIFNNSFLNSTLWKHIEQNPSVPGTDRLFNIRNNTFYFTKNNFEWLPFNFSNPDFLSQIPYELIKIELCKKHNVINHSGVCFTKEFWNSYDKFGNKLRYRNDKPFEDLSLWIRAVQNNIKITIVNKHLIDYRRHSNSICSTANSTLDSAKGPDLNERNIGIKIIIKIETDLEKITKLDINKFYIVLIYDLNLEEKTYYELKKQNIKHIIIKIFDEELPFEKYLENYKETIEMNCDIIDIFD